MARKVRHFAKPMTIQITSMLDAFTIILVFLLKSVGSNTVDIQVSKNMVLPISSSEKPPIEVLTMIVDRNGIVLDGKLIVNHNNGVVEAQYLDETGFKIIPLYNALLKHAEKAKFIAEQNKKFQFDGKILLQMDKELPFSILRQVMYTSGQAEYAEFKFVAIKK